MKKVLILLSLLGYLMLSGAHAQAVLIPEAGKVYNIIHSSGYMLTKIPEGSNTVAIKDISGAADQQFRFIPVGDQENTYNIQCLLDDSYLAQSKGYTWDLAWGGIEETALPSGQFLIEVLNESQVKIKNLNISYVGTDSNNEGSFVYTNKPGNDGKHYWVIKEFVEGELVTDALESKIAEAENLLATTSEGTSTGEYLPEVRTALQDAIDIAKEVLGSATSQSEISGAVTTIQTAINTYNSSVNLPSFSPKDGATYLMSSAKNSGYVSNDGTKLTVDKTYGTARWSFKKVSDNTFIVYSGELAVSSTLALVALDESSADQYWTVHYDRTQNGKEYYCFSNASGQYWALTSGGAMTLQTNHDNHTNTAHWFTIEEVSGSAVTAGLENALASANKALEGVSVGDGLYQYPQAIYDEMVATRDEAQTLLNDESHTQEAVDEMTSRLTEITGNFVDSKKIFIWEEGAKYNIIHSSGLYLGNSDNKVLILTENSENAATQQFNIVPVAEETGTYNIQLASDETYLTKDGRYALAWATDPTVNTAKYKIVAAAGYFIRIKCLDNSSYMGTDATESGSGVYIDKAGNANNHYWIINKVGAPNPVALIMAINTATATLNSKVIGDELGKWSQATYDAFKAEIDKAAVVITSATSQADIDNAVVALQNAETIYNESENKITSDALKASVAAAQELYKSMVVGEKQGEYLYSIKVAFADVVTEYETLLRTETDEEALDAAAVVLDGIIDEYKVKANAVDIELSVVLKEIIDLLTPVYEESATNEGYEKGQYPAEVRAMFKAALDNAATNGTREDIEGLFTARDMFLAGVVKVDRSALATAIVAAKEKQSTIVAGKFDGQYEEAAVNTFNEAIETAETFYATAWQNTQAEIKAATTTLENAVKAVEATKVTIDFTFHNAILEKAISYIVDTDDNTAVVNENVALKEARTAAHSIDGAMISQENLDALDGAVEDAIKVLILAMKKTSGLESALEDANKLYEETEVGLNPGNISTNNKKKLKKAIDNAQEVYDNAEVTTDGLAEAVATLKAAIDTFKGQIITGIGATAMEQVKVTSSKGRIEVENAQRVNIVDISGQIVVTIECESMYTSIPVNTGVYLVQVQAGNQMKTIKVIVK